MVLLLPSPRQCHRSSGLLDWWRSNQVRGVVYQHPFRGQGTRGPFSGGSDPGVSSDSTASGSCLVDTDRDDISGIQIPCFQSSFPLAASCASCCGGSRQAGVRIARQEQSRCRMQPSGHCRMESFKNERVLGVLACHGRPSGAGVRGLHHGRLVTESSS